MTTLWKHGEIPKADIANEGGVNFPRSKKPEQLIKRILERSTNEGDLVLDSFLGSGTTSAVAHKMHRRWIGIEMGDHAYSHCKVRMDSVIDGTDLIGVTKSTNWTGGGGYTFYELAPTLINTDSFGQEIINKEYNPDMLAAAVAMHEGFKYEPDTIRYWKQAKNENNTYLYVTTNHVNEELINSIKAELKDDEFFNCKVLKDLEEIKKLSKVIIANRWDDCLNEFKNKVYTRDLLNRD